MFAEVPTARFAAPASSRHAKPRKSNGMSDDWYSQRGPPCALDECGKANELAPSPIAFRLLGFAHLKRDELDAAIAASDQAIRMYANYDSALYGRGLARKRKGDQSGGEADIAAAMSINPKVAEDI
jgi:tetratricopeptide (TPR) repeat protein